MDSRSATSGWPTRLRSSVRRTAIAVAMCGTLAAPAPAAEWSASAGWGLRLDPRRVLGAPAARLAPWTQAVTPALSLAGEPFGTRVDAAASGRLEAGPLGRGTAGEARAALARTFAPGFEILGEGSLARARDLLDVDHATVSADGDATRWGASARGVSPWLEAEGRVRGWRSQASHGETRSLGAGARGFLERSAAGALFLGAHERRLERDRATLLRARAAALGAQRDVMPGLGVTLELGGIVEEGGADARSGPGREAPRPAAALELASPRGGAERATELRVRIARELGTEFEVELLRRAGRASASARASSSVGIEGSDAAGPAVIERAVLAARDTLDAATVFAVEASVARSRPYRGLPVEPVTATRIGVWVERRVQPWLSGRAGWDLLQRRGDGVDAAPGFRRSRFEIQLRASAR